jgi:hypothetical protein
MMHLLQYRGRMWSARILSPAARMCSTRSQGRDRRTIAVTAECRFEPAEFAQQEENAW